MITSPLDYLIWLLIFIWGPAAIFWWIDLGQVRKHTRALVACALTLAALCLPTEYWIVHEVLILRPGHFLGLYFLGIPLEDYLFFVSFPFLVAPVALKLESVLSKDVECREN